MEILWVSLFIIFQNVIEKLKKLLMKLGYNLDDPYSIRRKRAGTCEGNAKKLVKKSKIHIHQSHLNRLKLAKIVQRLEQVIKF